MIYLEVGVRWSLKSLPTWAILLPTIVVAVVAPRYLWKLSLSALNKNCSTQVLLVAAGAAIKSNEGLPQPVGAPQGSDGQQGSFHIISARNRQEQLASRRMTALSCCCSTLPATFGQCPEPRDFKKQKANTQREQHCKSSCGSSIYATLTTRLWNMMRRVERVHGCNEMKLLSWSAWAMHFFVVVLCKLHRSLTHEGGEKKKKKHSCAASGFFSPWLLSSRQ